MADSSIQSVIDALAVLYSGADKDARDKVNTWLGEFQKSVRRLLARAFLADERAALAEPGWTNGTWASRSVVPLGRSGEPGQAHCHDCNVWRACLR